VTCNQKHHQNALCFRRKMVARVHHNVTLYVNFLCCKSAQELMAAMYEAISHLGRDVFCNAVS